MSEALHSGIDLIAAAMTLVAVRMGDRPPDLDHQYGHEKIESMSSLAETLLLFITCIWIVYEAMNRLFVHSVDVEITYVAILIMLLSIAVDYTRSRALMKVAKKYKSQALEADAIHFSTDLLSSVVVLIGILFTMAGFKSFDAIAALGVAVITAVIGWRLWKRSMHTLLDGAPAADVFQKVNDTALGVPGVIKVGRVRVRESGHKTFVDALVYIDRALPLEQAHKVTEDVTSGIEALVPDADVMIHAEPVCPHTDDLVQLIREEAALHPEIKTVHNIVISDVEEDVHVDLHLEMDGELSLEKAHDAATRFEERIMGLDDCITYVSSHLEPVGVNHGVHAASTDEISGLSSSIRSLAIEDPNIKSMGDVIVRRNQGHIEVSVCCRLDRCLNVHQAHEIATDLENRIRARHEDVHSVNVHMEPHPPGPE